MSKCNSWPYKITAGNIYIDSCLECYRMLKEITKSIHSNHVDFLQQTSSSIVIKYSLIKHSDIWLKIPSNFINSWKIRNCVLDRSESLKYTAYIIFE